MDLLKFPPQLAQSPADSGQDIDEVHVFVVVVRAANSN